MIVGFSVFEVGYANRTTANAIGRKISVEALDGPLQFLNAVWNFEPRDESHTQIHFSVDYALSNPVLAAVASRAFSAMFDKILDAFEQRAAELFSDRSPIGAKHKRY